MTTFLLIRHGMTDAVGKRITGRLPGVHLNKEGRAQADDLPARLRGWTIGAIYSSPLERALETAAPLAQSLGLPVIASEEFTEVGFGEWSGMTLDELDCEEQWQRYNELRSSVHAPAGELMLEIQVRLVREFERLRLEHPGATVAVFSHADVIKAAVMHYLGMPIDLFRRLEIEPASITETELGEFEPRVLRVNEGG